MFDWKFYKNGNIYTQINLDDGTLIKVTLDDEWKPEFASSIDINISNKCDNGCSFCYQGCTKDGKEADLLNMELLNSFQPYTEVAFNINSNFHPQMVQWLWHLRHRKVIANATIHLDQFIEKYTQLEFLIHNKDIFGLGVSVDRPVTKEELELLKSMPNIVIHLVAGLINPNTLASLAGHNLKLLILGYKNKGRGLIEEPEKRFDIEDNIRYIGRILPLLEHDFPVLSFDNLAVEQLSLIDRIRPEIWKERYMGDDGQFTFYLDLVNKEYGPSSTSNIRFPMTNDVVKMFQYIRSLNNVG